MKSTTRKLLLSLSTFLFALVALFGATFAWFSQADTVSVDSIQFNVTSGDNLQVATTNIETYDLINLSSATFLSSLTTAQVTALYDYQHAAAGRALWKNRVYTKNDVRLTPLSSVNGINYFVEQKAEATAYDQAAYAYVPQAGGIFYFDVKLTFKASALMSVHLAYDALSPLIVTEKPLGTPAAYQGNYRIAFILEGQTTPVMIYESDATDAKTNSFASNTHLGFTFPAQTTTNALENGASGNNRINSKLFEITSLVDLAAYQSVTVAVWIEGWDYVLDRPNQDVLKNSVLKLNLKFVGVTA